MLSEHEQEWFLRLWADAQPAVTAFVHAVVRDSSAAKDLVQETALVLFRRFSDKPIELDEPAYPLFNSPRFEEVVVPPLEYAIPWSLLGGPRPPRSGEILAMSWTAHWSEEGGRLWRGQWVELRNSAEPIRIHTWERAATWGRAVFQ
jgi:hypothetical protein